MLKSRNTQTNFNFRSEEDYPSAGPGDRLLTHLRRAFAAARQENHRRKEFQSPGTTRRRFMTSTAGGLIASYAAKARASRQETTIAVVGAGIAGLNATYLLAKAGFDVALYEGSDHIGGRIQTKADAVAPGFIRNSAANSSIAITTICWPCGRPSALA